MSSTISTNVTLTIEPSEGQTNEEAAAEFLTLFKEYLQNPEGTFLTDYGEDAWGGYEGPTVSSVHVEELVYDFDTTAALLNMHPAFLRRFIIEGDLPSIGTPGKDLRIRHSDLIEFQKARAAGREILNESLNPNQLSLLGDDGNSPA